MKEKELVDFDNMSEEERNDVGCGICHTHGVAWGELTKRQFSHQGGSATKIFISYSAFHPLCPECGEPLVGGANHGYAPGGYATVSEGNFVEPDGEISLCPLWHCQNEKCSSKEHQYLFATMPIPIVWNANHNIHYTGGRTYLLKEEDTKFAKSIFKAIEASIKQFVERKLHPKDDGDRHLTVEDNLMLWCSRDIEEAYAKWLYDHGLKKQRKDGAIEMIPIRNAEYYGDRSYLMNPTEYAKFIVDRLFEVQ